MLVNGSTDITDKAVIKSVISVVGAMSMEILQYSKIR